MSESSNLDYIRAVERYRRKQKFRENAKKQEEYIEYSKDKTDSVMRTAYYNSNKEEQKRLREGLNNRKLKDFF